MKKTYDHPHIEIEHFAFTDILTASEGIGPGDGVIDPWDDYAGPGDQIAPAP